MTEDERQLDLLAIFHYIVGGLTAVTSCIFLVHVAMGVALLLGVFDGKDSPPRIIGWILVAIPGLFMLTGWTLAGFMIAAGRRLKRRASRTFCLVVAAVGCAVMPLGTVLGVFTIIVLMRDSVKTMFADHSGVCEGLEKPAGR